MPSGKRSLAGMARRREQQRKAYRKKYASNRNSELARRANSHKKNRDFELDRAKFYYDQITRPRSANERIKSDPSRGLAKIARDVVNGRVELSQYHRLVSERLALANELSPDDGNGSTTSKRIRNRARNSMRKRHRRTDQSQG